jgi:poly(A) polymerase
MAGIKDILLDIKRLAKENGLSEPYIVGGMPRDKVLNRMHKIEDIDLTSGDESIFQLAEVTANHFQVNPMRFPDGHYQIWLGPVKLDFSSNYNSPDAGYFLNKAGVENPSEMKLELFSRDFTCNTLIAPLTLRKIIDPTGMALEDIKRKVIRTPLPPRITLRDDTKRVVRAIYLAAKLGFQVERDIVIWARKHPDKIREEVSQGFAKRKLAAATRANPEATVKLLTAMDLWSVVGIPRVLAQAQGGMI